MARRARSGGAARAWRRRAAARASKSKRRGRGAGGVGDWRPAAGGVGGERNVREEGRVRVDPTVVTVLHESQTLEGEGEKPSGRCIGFRDWRHPSAWGRGPFFSLFSLMAQAHSSLSTQ